MKIATRTSNGLRYVGGKFEKAPWIVSLMPEHSTYCEAFGGAAHVLYAKEPSINEVYNDINSDMVNLFKVLQSEEKTQRLTELLYWTPHSREFFYEVRSGAYVPEAAPDVQAAYTLLVLISQSFAAAVQGRKPGWGFITGGKGGGQSKTIAGLPQKILQLADRMRRVQIEHLDFRECLKKYDSPDTFFLLDPPYFNAEFYYEHKFTRQDHADLAEIANRLQAKVMVCYYNFPGMREFYPPEKWRLLEKDFCKGSCPTDSRGMRDRATECLLLNYEPPAVGEQLTLFEEEGGNE